MLLKIWNFNPFLIPSKFKKWIHNISNILLILLYIWLLINDCYLFNNLKYQGWIYWLFLLVHGITDSRLRSLSLTIRVQFLTWIEFWKMVNYFFLIYCLFIYCFKVRTEECQRLPRGTKFWDKRRTLVRWKVIAYDLISSTLLITYTNQLKL